MTRQLRNGITATMVPGPLGGPGIATPDFESVLAALERFDPAIPWEAARRIVLPMLQRRRAHPFDTSGNVAVTLPPGLVVGFGLDLGPAVAFVGAAQLESWAIGPADLVAAALDNVRARASGIRPHSSTPAAIDGMSLEVLQSGMGIASVLLLVPETLTRILGPGPKVLGAPMRDVLLALPPDTAASAAAWITREFATADPNGLDLGVFRLDGGTVSKIWSDGPGESDPGGSMLH